MLLYVNEITSYIDIYVCYFQTLSSCLCLYWPIYTYSHPDIWMKWKGVKCCHDWTIQSQSDILSCTHWVIMLAAWFCTLKLV